MRLRPRAGADVFDLALAGRVAVVDAIEEDMEGAVHLVVCVDDDPGRDLGVAAQLAHRFFFAPEEVEPLAPARILVAGIGNVFLGDDGFGCALAERLAERPLPAGRRGRRLRHPRHGPRLRARRRLDAVVLLDAAPTRAAAGHAVA